MPGLAIDVRKIKTVLPEQTLFEIDMQQYGVSYVTVDGRQEDQLIGTKVEAAAVIRDLEARQKEPGGQGNVITFPKDTAAS
jgi:hypothetical protein